MNPPTPIPPAPRTAPLDTTMGARAEGDPASDTRPAVAVGVAILGHGDTASRLLAAALSIVPGSRLADIVAIDAGQGETPRLDAAVRKVVRALDHGRGVVVLVDLLGASPCQCAQRQTVDLHELVVLSGLNLAMLLKLASVDRSRLSAVEVAEACADSAHRSVSVWEAPEGLHGPSGPEGAPKEATG